MRDGRHTSGLPEANAARIYEAGEVGSNASVYVSLSRLRIPPERAEDLVEAFRGRLGAVDAHEGFVDLQVWQSDRDPGELVMVSRWRDRAAFRDYMRSADHRASHERIPPDLDAAIELERLEHLHTYDVVAE